MTSSESVIRTCHEFIAALVEQSAAIAAMALHNRMIDATLGGDAFNLANCAAHRRLIARAVDGLISNGFSSVDNVANLLANVSERAAPMALSPNWPGMNGSCAAMCVFRRTRC